MNLVHPFRAIMINSELIYGTTTYNSPNPQAACLWQAEMQEQRVAPGVDTFRHLVEMCRRSGPPGGGVTQ